MDNLNDAYDARLKQWRLTSLIDSPNFQYAFGDIRQGSDINSVCKEGKPFDAIINLAARAGVRQSVDDPWVYQETNVTGTLNLLEMCRKYNIKKFVLASTSSLYGARNQIPYREDADTNCPLSPYAASKKAAEALCYSYHHLHKIDVSILRYFTVYGPAGRPDMSVFRFVKCITENIPITVYGDGNQSRDFTYVDDIARGTVLAIQPVGFEVFNLGSDQPFQLRELITKIEKRVGRKARVKSRPSHPADVLATWADVTKARKQLGWRASVAGDEGISRTVDWYLDNRTWASQISFGSL
jgi:nucleoside-diphosphate-sugar epimerase